MQGRPSWAERLTGCLQLLLLHSKHIHWIQDSHLLENSQSQRGKWNEIESLSVWYSKTVCKRELQPWPGGSVGWDIILYTKRLRVQSSVGVCRGGNQSMFLFYINVLLSLPLLPSPPSKINKTSSSEDFLKMEGQCAWVQDIWMVERKEDLLPWRT